MRKANSVAKIQKKSQLSNDFTLFVIITVR